MNMVLNIYYWPFLLGILLLVTACGGSEAEEQAWQEVVAENTLSSLDSFLIKFPETSRKAAIAKKREAILYAIAIDRNTIFHYKNYLKEFPQGKNKKEIEQKLNEYPNPSINLEELTTHTFVGTIKYPNGAQREVISLKFTAIKGSGSEPRIAFDASVHLSADIRKSLSGEIIQPEFRLTFTEKEDEKIMLMLADGRAYKRNGKIFLQSVDPEQNWTLQ